MRDACLAGRGPNNGDCPRGRATRGIPFPVFPGSRFSPRRFFIVISRAEMDVVFMQSDRSCYPVLNFSVKDSQKVPSYSYIFYGLGVVVCSKSE